MRIASFDIETTDLRANMGTLLCASFHEIVPPGYYGNHHDTPNKPYTFVVEDTFVGDPNPRVWLLLYETKWRSTMPS